MSSSGSASVAAPSRHNKDPTWKYCRYNETDKSRIICNFCGRSLTNGITRMRKHLLGITGDVTRCDQIPATVRDTLKDEFNTYMAGKGKRARTTSSEWEPARASFASYHNTDNYFDIDLEREVAPSSARHSVDLGTTRRGSRLSRGSGLSANPGGPRVQSDRRMEQQKIDECLPGRNNEYVDTRVARFFYENAIPFHVASTASYKDAINAVGNYGRGYIPPSAHILSGKLLKQEVEMIEKEIVSKHRREWSEYGCTLMADGWKDANGRKLINFIVYTGASKSLTFLKSIVVEEQTTATYLERELLKVIDNIGSKNVIQLVTDQEASFKRAGGNIMQKYPHIYWSACAAHVCDLILHDVEKLSFVGSTIKEARQISTFVHNRAWVLTQFLRHSNGRYLIRPGLTRFATSFIALRSILDHHKALQELFISDEWKHHPLSKTSEGKAVKDTVFNNDFVKKVKSVLALGEPILKVLRMTDTEVPIIGRIYEAFCMVKKVISVAHNNKTRRYHDIFKIIDRRWKDQLHNDLHAAAFKLNPEYLVKPEIYSLVADFGIISEDQLLRSTYTCLNRVLIDQERATQAILQVRQFHARFGSMGTQSALRAAQSADPVEWWYAFGLDVPELREAAVRILCQTTSSSGCERNWSTFDLIHTKRRNRLQNKRLNDLVFVHYNSRLQERNKRTHRKIMNMDPINLSTFFIDDPLEDWLQEEQPIDLNQEDVDTILSREENIEAEENIDNNPPPPPPEESIDIPSGYNDNAYVPSSWNVPEVDEQDFVPEAFYNYDFTQFSLDENMNFQLPTSHGYVDTGGSGGRYGGPFGGQDGIPHGHRSGGSSSFGGESSSGYAGGSSGDGRGTGGGDGSDTWFSGGYNYPTGWEQQH